MSLPRSFTVDTAQLRVVASGLHRPECVLATAKGELHTADWGGGVAVSVPGQPGKARLISGALPTSNSSANHTPHPATQRATRPNGICITQRGTWLFADLGETEGGIFELFADGRITPFITHVEGSPLPPSNFVIEDAQGRTWFTVSTRLVPRSRAWNRTVADGFIGVHDGRGTRVVADGLGYTNEIAFSPDGEWLYVNETYARRVSRFALRSDASLGPKETVAELGPGNFPDGIVFDSEGNAWVTCIVGNRVLVIRPNGEIQVVLDSADPAYVTAFEEKYLAGTLAPPDTAQCGTSPLGNISSLAFGGADLRTAYLGCLLDDKIRAFDVPVSGHRLLHWSA
jgi:sugar lactone lactonase YvrE